MQLHAAGRSSWTPTPPIHVHSPRCIHRGTHSPTLPNVTPCSREDQLEAYTSIVNVHGELVLLCHWSMCAYTGIVKVRPRARVWPVVHPTRQLAVPGWVGTFMQCSRHVP